MHKLIAFIFIPVLVACSAQPLPTEIPTLSPTLTPSLAPTATIQPTPTLMPGEVVVPIEEMGTGIPWLPDEKVNIPSSEFVYFNLRKPPFNNTQVRQAFSAATDRVAIAAIATKYQVREARPGTTITPPAILGRDLYNQVGIPYDPVKARELFSEAGYSDPLTFPEVTFLVSLSPGGRVPTFNQKLAEGLTAMWKEVLGIDIAIESVSYTRYREMRGSDPAGIFVMGWLADEIDPDNFLRSMFRTGADMNFGHFSDIEFDRLVDEASLSGNPSERQESYIQAEKILCEEKAGVIPLFTFISYIP